MLKRRSKLEVRKRQQNALYRAVFSTSSAVPQCPANWQENLEMFTKGQLSAASNSDYLAARSTKQANLTIAHSTYVIYTSLSSKLSLLEVVEEKRAKYIVRLSFI